MQPSIFIPVFNEEDNIPILLSELTTVADKLDGLYENVFVNVTLGACFQADKVRVA